MSERDRVWPVLVALFVGMSVADVSHADNAGSTTRTCAPPDGVNPHDDPVLVAPADTVAKELLRQGRGAHRAQDYDEAIEAFKEGTKRSSAPVFLYSLGQSLRVSGRFEEAIRAYELFLDRGQPGEALRGVVECHIANMRADLERAAMTMPPTDQPEEPSIGPDLSVRADPIAPPPWYSDGVGWGLAAGGLAVGTIGALLLLDAASLDDEAALEDREPVRAELRDKADGRRLWGSLVTATGAVALTAGVVKLALTPNARRHDGAAVVVMPGAVALVGRF